MTVPPIELGTGLLTYGTFSFPNAVKARIGARPHQDTTQRYTKYVTYRLEVETVLYPGVDVDYHTGAGGQDNIPFFPEAAPSADGLNLVDGMDGVRRVLSTRGLDLNFEDKGYGRFNINTSQRDILNGPTPEILAWEPVGDNFAVRIVWGVVVTLAECGELTVVNVGRLTEISYSVAYSIDIAGLTTRTISGFYDITLDIRTGVVRNNADVSREILGPLWPIPIGFARASQDFLLNARRDRLDFRIVDREYPADDQNRMHKGVVENDIRQNTRSVGGVLSTRWHTTLRGKITVAKGQTRYLAWLAFLSAVNSRMERARQEGNIRKGSTKDPDGFTESTETRSMKAIVLGDLSITEEFYGRSLTFSFGWTSFSTLGNLINAAGIFQQIPGATETGQITSLTAPNQAWTVRGQKQLRWFGGEAIVSLCSQKAPTSLTNLGNKKLTTQGREVFRTKRPSAEESWLCFDYEVNEVEMTNRYASTPANGAVRGEDSSFKLGDTSSGRTSTGVSQAEVTTIPTIHQSGGHSSRLVFTGRAARLGHKIPKIHLKSYAGADVTPTGFGWQKDFGSVDLGGVLLYKAKWEMEYVYAGTSQPSDNVITDPDPQTANANCSSFSF